ncbi:hypothetical protein U9M48_043762 [Paspalum notatum var. saurae]|uniref:Uncharacterized protein n=1 Tax=Paspalum notatum var. saurae TaxID=547442 RepID=A0AAQ3XFW4_PASNO
MEMVRVWVEAPVRALCGKERYRLYGEGDYEKEKMAKRVFNKAAAKVVRDSFSNARIQAIVNFHKRVKNLNVKKTADLKKMHLDVEELIQGDIDWIMKDPEAWRWICHHWAGMICREHLIETETIEPVRQGSKGSGQMALLAKNNAWYAKYKENVIQRHGLEFDWRVGAPDVEAIYDAGGGLRHGSPPRTSQGSSSRRPSRAQQEAQQEETRRLQEKTFKLRQNNDYIMTYLVTLSQKLGGDVLEFRAPQPSPQVPPNYFSSPINQKTPLGDAQGWLGSNAPEFRPPKLIPQVPPNYFTTPTSQGSPLGDAQGSQPPLNQIIPSGQSQPPPQWVYPDQPMMMYRGQQPMFYPANQPPYYMPWRSTAPPMTPPGRP